MGPSCGRNARSKVRLRSTPWGLPMSTPRFGGCQDSVERAPPACDLGPSSSRLGVARGVDLHPGCRSGDGSGGRDGVDPRSLQGRGIDPVCPGSIWGSAQGPRQGSVHPPLPSPGKVVPGRGAGHVRLRGHSAANLEDCDIPASDADVEAQLNPVDLGGAGARTDHPRKMRMSLRSGRRASLRRRAAARCQGRAESTTRYTVARLCIEQANPPERR